MSNNLSTYKKSSKPVCIGTGLLALDIVIDVITQNSPALWAGGSCGNVLTILSYLGWETYPVARLSDDTAGSQIIKDLELWNVNTHFISRNQTGSTPIIIERIDIGKNGLPRHRFEWECPLCGAWLPRFKPVLAKEIPDIAENMPKPHAYYFDRVSRGAIDLAQQCRQRGGLVVFEPSSIKDEKLFHQAISLAHIVKYSYDRLRDVSDITHKHDIPMEIQTLGSEGIRYRTNSRNTKRSKWIACDAFPVNNLRDAAGAGDWCTAGIMHQLGHHGEASFLNATQESFVEAIRFGQAIASINCSYAGARGLMYVVSRSALEQQIASVLNDLSSLESKEAYSNCSSLEDFPGICPQCPAEHKN